MEEKKMERATRQAWRTALVVEPERIDFRDVEVGVCYRQVVTIRNVMTALLVVSFILTCIFQCSLLSNKMLSLCSFLKVCFFFDPIARVRLL